MKPILEPIDNITVYEGDNVTVVCKAKSVTLPIFQWLISDKNNMSLSKLITSEQYEYVAPSSRNKLHQFKLFLAKISYKHEGKYTCLSGTNIGYDTSSFFLQVLARTNKSAGIYFVMYCRDLVM